MGPSGGLLARGRMRRSREDGWDANRTLPGSAHEKYWMRGRQGRQIVCLIYTFA